MIFCKVCGTQLDDNATVCTCCGSQVTNPAAQQTYTDTQPAYTAPQGGYTAPQGGYTAPQGGYAAPQGGYAAPQGYAPQTVGPKSSGLITATKIFMIIGTVILGITGFLVPLAWCIPMTVIYFKKIERGEPLSVVFKVCSLLFVSLLAGIFMLIDSEQ